MHKWNHIEDIYSTQGIAGKSEFLYKMDQPT